MKSWRKGNFLVKRLKFFSSFRASGGVGRRARNSLTFQYLNISKLETFSLFHSHHSLFSPRASYLFSTGVASKTTNFTKSIKNWMSNFRYLPPRHIPPPPPARPTNDVTTCWLSANKSFIDKLRGWVFTINRLTLISFFLRLFHLQW